MSTGARPDPATTRPAGAWPRVLTALAAVLVLAGCLQTPSGSGVDPVVASGIPDHSAFGTTPCASCHGADRPASTISATTGAAVVHGGGRDCGECHVAGAANWRVFLAFSHSPVPATCNDCHLDRRPATLVNDRMLHTYPGIGDCAGCHAAGAGATWANGNYAHQPLPGTCAECHAARRPTTVVNGFSHDAGGQGDCASCHLNPGVTWSGAFFDHSPEPASCAGCHAGIRPAGPVGNPPFDHAIAGTGDCKSCHLPLSATQPDWSGASFSHSPAPATCSGCHAGIRPVGPAGASGFDHAQGGSGDCKSCHLPKSITQTDWSGGTFSHSPAPATCSDCHLPDRPTGLVGSPAFDHAIAGTGDCKSCHVPLSASKTDFSGGNFSHVPAPDTCSGCHLARRPDSPTASGFNHITNGAGDCADCHRNPGVTWAGATGFDHGTLPFATRCDSCHAGERPAVALAVPWPGHPATPNQFLHSVVASLDCRGCHANAGVAWPPGVYQHAPDPGQCSVCHRNQRPVGPVGTPVFDHALGGQGDCAACHAVPGPGGGDWSGGRFTHTTALTSCAGCHEYQRPAGLVGNPPFNHAIAGTGDCKSCHAIKSATQTDFSGGTFSHVPTPTTCSGCHSGIRPAAAVRGTGLSTDGRSYVNDFLHGLVAGDCKGCHAPPGTTQGDWSGGRYAHSPVPGSCTTCHAVTRPGPGGSSFDHTQPGLADCKACHAFPGQRWTGASAVPAVVTLTPPTGKNWPVISAAHPVIDSAKAGLTCTSCHGSNPNAKIIDYDHAFPVAGAKCVYCHYSGQTETSAAVTTKSHFSTSNTKDCNSAGCHRPKSYPTWKAASGTFSGGEWGEP